MPQESSAAHREEHDHPQGGARLHRRRVRKRRRRSPFTRYVVKPAWELGGAAIVGVRRFPLVFGALGIGVLWWIWPLLPGIPGLPRAAARSSYDVITTFVEDPQRTVGAIALWKQRPGSLLVLQGQPSSQAENKAFLESQGQWPRDVRGMVVLKPGCDTFGQLRALQRWLGSRRSPGTLTVVTSPAHLPRATAIARILLGSEGWQVQGFPVLTGDNRPESFWRQVRDQFRAQLFRATGWDAGSEIICRERLTDSI
jgi:hypothetical protein